MMKRIFSLVLALAMAIALLLPAMSLTASAANTSNDQRFTDVSPDAWYYDAVEAMARAGIISGTGDGSFEPDRLMTAGELATVLWNMTYGTTWCKATELYNTFDNGYNTSYTMNYSEPNYYGPRYDGWGVAKNYEGSSNTPFSELIPTTWDGAVSLAIYGDSRLDPIGQRGSGNFPDLKTVNRAARTQINLLSGRVAGSVKSANSSNYGVDLGYSRDMSGLAIVAMSKETVTRGFAISELVNVLRETGYLEGIFNASSSQDLYPTGASIPDWADITNAYHDICSASDKGTLGSFDNKNGYQLFHGYTWAWNYIDEPGNIQISGGYAATWFSADVLLA